MDERFLKVADVSRESEDQSLRMLEKLIDAATPEAVFSKPIEVGGSQVITASEVSVGLGFGHGFGKGPKYITNLGVDDGESAEGESMGSGGGGGGGAGARPVAVISISEDEVKVQPIFDATKIALAFFTMLGSIFFLGAQMKRRKM